MRLNKPVAWPISATALLLGIVLVILAKPAIRMPGRSVLETPRLGNPINVETEVLDLGRSEEVLDKGSRVESNDPKIKGKLLQLKTGWSCIKEQFAQVRSSHPDELDQSVGRDIDEVENILASLEPFVMMKIYKLSAPKVEHTPNIRKHDRIIENKTGPLEIFYRVFGASLKPRQKQPRFSELAQSLEPEHVQIVWEGLWHKTMKQLQSFLDCYSQNKTHRRSRPLVSMAWGILEYLSANNIKEEQETEQLIIQDKEYPRILAEFIIATAYEDMGRDFFFENRNSEKYVKTHPGLGHISGLLTDWEFLERAVLEVYVKHYKNFDFSPPEAGERILRTLGSILDDVKYKRIMDQEPWALAFNKEDDEGISKPEEFETHLVYQFFLYKIFQHCRRYQEKILDIPEPLLTRVYEFGGMFGDALEGLNYRIALISREEVFKYSWKTDPLRNLFKFRTKIIPADQYSRKRSQQLVTKDFKYLIKLTSGQLILDYSDHRCPEFNNWIEKRSRFVRATPASMDRLKDNNRILSEYKNGEALGPHTTFLAVYLGTPFMQRFTEIVHDLVSTVAFDEKSFNGHSQNIIQNFYLPGMYPVQTQTGILFSEESMER